MSRIDCRGGQTQIAKIFSRMRSVSTIGVK